MLSEAFSREAQRSTTIDPIRPQMDDGRLKVLLIEDDPDDYALVWDLLSESSCADYHIDWVKTYEDALQAIEDNTYAICLLDYLLGKRDGLSLFSEMRKRGCRIPIIFLSGHGDYTTDIEAMRLGAADYLVKSEISGPLLERSIRYAIRHETMVDELRRHQGKLEGLVQEHTEELERANQKLRLEIAERIEAQAALRKAHDELERRVALRTAELAAANAALETQSQKVKHFAYSISHDLKSPAVGIYGLARLLSRQYGDKLDERGKYTCDQLLRASEQVATLAEKINAYIAAKESPLAIEQVRLKEVLDMIREELSHQIGLRQIRWVEPPVLPEIYGDRLALLRALRNLVENALKHGAETLSTIEIGYRSSGSFHILSVTDDGIGINAKDSKQIFKIFKRKTRSRSTEGAGLGLAIVKEIAEQHGGKVWTEPGLQRGTAFHMSISTHLFPS